ncbi:MAG: DUF1611 domain-containing protein [Anaerotignum sp.]|nr:DUF1611 domain-containing protein [Anaerotignum sp.]
MKYESDIVIIDSGLNEEDLEKYKSCVIGTKSFLANGGVEDHSGHGTAVTNLILNQFATAKLFIIKVFNDKLECDEDTLIESLKFVYDNISCRFINLSLGISNPRNISKLYAVCTKIRSAGTVIISAYDNLGSISYPAAFDCVIGIDINNRCNKANEYIYVENSPINIYVKDMFYRVKWGSDRILMNGSSFATANFTGIVASNFEGGDIYFYLKTHSKDVISYEFGKTQKTTSSSYQIPRKPIIIHYTKEIQSMLNFSNLLQFEIHDIFDYKLSGNIGKKVTSIRSVESTVYQIKNIDEINWENESFDSVILSHVKQLELLIGKSILETTHDFCKRFNKKLFTFDSTKFQDVFSPCTLENKDVINSSNDKLYIINKPVLGIFGTSSQQGKFTLQLSLREKFLSSGYNIGQLGTEPQSLFFGIDECYTMGYYGNIKTSGYQTVYYLNSLMHRMDEKDIDLIIVGSQSGTTTYWVGNLKQYPIRQIEFLLGTLPDAVILCVNIFDDVDYIARTIKLIEGAVDTKVIAFAVYPFEYKNEWDAMMNKKNRASISKIQSFKLQLYEAFGILSYEILNDNDTENLFKECINYFGE